LILVEMFLSLLSFFLMCVVYEVYVILLIDSLIVVDGVFLVVGWVVFIGD